MSVCLSLTRLSIFRSLRNVEKLMVSGGLFGIRKRAMSDRRTSGSVEQYNPHHPDILREHSEQVLEKIKAFADMSVKIGAMYGKDMETCEAAVA